MNAVNASNRARIALAALVLILGAYWAGERFGPRQPTHVEALPLGGSRSPAAIAQRDAGLTDDESINVRIYRQASPAVANILTKATEYDFFMDPVPVEGAGSGFIIDPRGYILTNYHVVEGAQSIEVVLGDQSRHAAKYIGADQRNDVALIKIDPKGKQLAALKLGDSNALQVGQKRSEEHTSELQSRLHLVCRLLLEKKKNTYKTHRRIETEMISVSSGSRSIQRNGTCHLLAVIYLLL